jgi:hypothetical protein
MSLVNDMFREVLVYVWTNPLDDCDFGAILISLDNFDLVQRYTENCDTRYTRQPQSFYDFKDRLKNDDIDFVDITDNVQLYVFTE